MNEVIADWISTAVEVLLTAMLIAGFLAIFAVAQTINADVTEQQALTVVLKEYREHNQFDFKHVYQQDVISAIYKGRGMPAVHVKSSKGTYSWTLSGAPCEYTTAKISALIDQTVLYDSSLKYGTNGEVIGYEFVPHVNGCGR